MFETTFNKFILSWLRTICALTMALSGYSAFALSPVMPVDFLKTSLQRSSFVGQVLITRGVLVKSRAKYEGKVESVIKGAAASAVVFYGSQLKVGQSYLIFLKDADSSLQDDAVEFFSTDIGEAAVKRYTVVSIYDENAALEIVPQKEFNRPVTAMYGSPKGVVLLPCESNFFSLPRQLTVSDLYAAGDRTRCWTWYNDVVNHLKSQVDGSK